MREPLIGIKLHNRNRTYPGGSILTGECQVDAVDAEELAALEVSVLWYTEGKGDEDLAVHYFQRLSSETHENLHELRQFSTPLPNSPLSYEGAIFKIRWCVRIRVFLTSGREVVAEQAFRLGNAPQELLALGRPR